MKFGLNIVEVNEEPDNHITKRQSYDSSLFFDNQNDMSIK